jgi:hypothetical protein
MLAFVFLPNHLKKGEIPAASREPALNIPVSLFR